MKPGVNPYKVLGLETGCSEKDIQKAYRLQCLKWHPDKNLDNKEEAERRFIEAKEAFEFLFDKTKRGEYDRSEEKIRAAEQKYRERMEKADGNRRKLIDELNQREKAFNESLKRPAKDAPLTEAQKQKKRKMEEMKIRDEMEKIRLELEREANEEVKRQLNRKVVVEETTSTPKLLVKWKKMKEEDYTEASLRKLFEAYGNVIQISSIIEKKDRRKCIVEFEPDANAWGAETEQGSGLEIKAEWIEKPREQNSRNQFETMSLDDLEAMIGI